MRLLMTGDQGFVGTATKEYFGNSHEIFGYDLMAGFDIRDLNQLEQVVSTFWPERILHLAAIARFSDADKNPWLAYQTNVRGTENVAYVAGKYHIPIVFASTGSVYMPVTKPPPITEEFDAYGNSTYGISKRWAELAIERVQNTYIILRYAHLYGKEKRHHGLIGGFVERIQRGLAPTLYGGKQSNDFTYIKDVARANYMALTAPWDKWNNVYNIGTGEEITAEDAGKIICQVAGYKGKIEKKDQRTVDPQRFVYSCSKSESMLGFKAQFNFKDGLSDMFGIKVGGEKEKEDEGRTTNKAVEARTKQHWGV